MFISTEYINREKMFNIASVASVVEVCYLDAPEKVYEFCNFITGKDINPGNIREYRGVILDILHTQYPTMRRMTQLPDGCCYSQNEIDTIVNNYKKLFGEKILIRSIVADERKVLKMKYKK